MKTKGASSTARIAACSAAALIAVAAATPARAEGAQEAAGLKAFEEGRRHFEARRFDDALRAFRASHDATPSPNSRLYVARCLRALGKTASAYSAFRLASREAEDRVRATGDKRYVATQESAALEASRLELLVPRVTLRVEPAARAAQAVVHVDGVELPRAAWAAPVELDPGAHEVVVSGPHVERSAVTVSLAERDAKELALPVKRVPFGTIQLAFRTKPTGLAVELDDAPIDLAAPASSREVAVGAHRLVAHAPGYATLRWEGAVADAARVEVPIDLVPVAPDAAPARATGPTRTPRWLFFTTAGAAALTAGAGAYFVLDARARDDAEQGKPVAERDPGVRDDIQSQARAGSVLLAAGGGLALAAGVLAFTTRWKAPTTGLVISPQVGAGRVGVAGEF